MLFHFYYYYYFFFFFNVCCFVFVDGKLLSDLQNIHKLTATSFMILYHKSYTPIITQQHMPYIVAIVDSRCLNAPCKGNQICHILLLFVDCSAHFFASRQMQLLKLGAAQGLGDSCCMDIQTV